MNLAVRHSRKDGDVGMAAQAKDMRYATTLKIADQLVGYEITHGGVLTSWSVQLCERLRDDLALIKLAEKLGIGRTVLRDRPAHPGDVHVVLE